MTRYQKALSIVFASFWIWMAINPVFRHSWFMENVPLFIFVPVVIFVGRALKMSSVWYTLIAIFMILHMVGAHYTYEEVPIGFLLGELFSSDRNMYDRFVHLCFGLLLAYPAFETFKKASRIGEYWNYFFTFNFIMMMAAGYEIAEWITSINSNPQASMAYIGAQGDIWDTQIDMYVAGLGCIFTLAVVYLMLRRVPISKQSRQSQPDTKSFAVIGSPVNHSLSPKMFDVAFEVCDIEAVYEARNIISEDLKRFLYQVRTGAYDGLSVTVPHKEKAIEFVDFCSPEAQSIGALNTIVRDGHTLSGHNTDWLGIRYALRDISDLENKRVLIYGAGGAARACIYALQYLGVKDISIMNRTEEKALTLAEKFNIKYAKSLEIPVDILINTTPIGLQAIDIFPISNEFLSRTEYVFDIVYGTTDLVTRAKRVGIKTIDGKEMLLGQAFEQFNLFFPNVDIPKEEMRKAIF